MSDGHQQQSRFPPMAISDLLVLTLCVSVAFAFSAGDFQDAFKLYVFKWHEILPDFIDLFVYGECLFGLIVLARQLVRKDNSMVAPGHVFLAAISPLQVIILIGGVFRPFFLANEPSAVHAIDYGVCAVVLALSLIYPIRTLRKISLPWRVVTCLLILTLTLDTLECCLDAAANLRWITTFHRGHILTMTGNFDAIMFVSIGFAVVIDLSRRVQRDWLHYLGVVTLTLHAASALMHWHRVMARWWQSLYNHIV
jgi:hypothetical protein